MRSLLKYLCLLFVSCAVVSGQQNSMAAPTAAQPVVPRLIRFTGQLKGSTGTVGITFTLHKAQQDESALWVETQNVQLDATGKYNVLLGVTKADGIPMELFTSGEAQWLGIHVEGQTEQPRVLLVSVPYAMKAAEAETLAGHTASEFVTSDKLAGAVQQQMQQTHFNTAESKQNAGQANAVNGVVTDPATNFTASNTTQVVAVTQTGTGQALVATAAKNTAITGTSTATTGAATGLLGQSSSTSGIGIRGFASATKGDTVGLFGSAASISGIAVAATESATTGYTTGLQATVSSPNGVAAIIQNKGGGKILSGRTLSANTEVFSVDGMGNLKASGNGVPIFIGDMQCGYGFGGMAVAGPSNCTNYSFLGSAVDTFVNRPSGGAIHFRENNGDEMIIMPGGAVGIGTGAPAATLEVNGSAQFDGNSAFNTATFNSGTFNSIGFSGGSGAISALGIGVAAPGSGLEVGGNATFDSGALFSSTAYITTTNNPDGLVVNPTSASEGIRVDMTNSSGNTGIDAFVGGGGTGVSGSSTGSNGVGVLGSGGSGADAGYFLGDVNVSGNLSKGGGSFKIDHPLDPAGKYLYHSFVESPDMMNIYNGNIVTDAAGFATVTMPEYFEALNRDFRYQLTVIGDFAQAVVAKEMEGNHFAIRTSKPNVKVSWMVTGVRQDAWANAHRIPNEVEKPVEEQGYYLHPELYGAPEEKQIMWAHHPKQMQGMREQREKAERKAQTATTETTSR